MSEHAGVSHKHSINTDVYVCRVLGEREYYAVGESNYVKRTDKFRRK